MKVIVMLAVVASVAGVLGGDARDAASSAPLNEPRARLNGVDPSGDFVVGRRPTFLIALGNPPPLGGKTPTGIPGPVEIVRTGVNLVRVGPAWTGWTRRQVAHVLAWQATAMRLGIHTWVRLNAFAATHSRWLGDARLAAVVHALTRSRFAAGLGLWQGADEPWSRGISANSLAFVYCRVSSRRNARLCAGEPTLDRHHPLVTILAPMGARAALAPYGEVTDGLGVDVYPVSLASADAPDLHVVGLWTRRIAGIMGNRPAWTTLQICAARSYDRQSGAYVLPTPFQERYMVFDAIINGARGISFFGGDNPNCWNATDRRYGWNWSFWNRALDPVIKQIAARSPLGHALANAGSNRVLAASDFGTEAISRTTIRHGRRQFWVLAARNGAGAKHVEISGLPASAKSATVYGERRTIPVSHGALSDTFRQWQVHVYLVRHGASQGR